MAQLSDFAPYILPYVPGCSSPLAEQYVRDVCIDFCMRSLIVQLALDPIDAIQGQIENDLDTPNGTLTHLILEAWYEGRPMGQFKSGDTCSQAEAFNLLFAGADVDGGVPKSVQLTPTNTFLFDVAPFVTSLAAVTMKVATKPTRKTTAVDDLLFNDYADVIGQGVVSRLMRIPGQTFTSGSWTIYESVYESARTSARIRAEKSFGRAATTVRTRRFI
jgi:hypothetical protein